MNTIKKILVALDLSDYSLPTLKYTAKLAHNLNASLILVNIVNERDTKAVYAALASYDIDLYQRITDQRIAERKSQLAGLAKAAEASSMVEKEIVRTD